MSDTSEHHRDRHGESCQCRPATLTVGQTLDEMDFERGIWNAAIYNDPTKIKDFIRRGDTDNRDNSGYSALHYAARNGFEEICRLLIGAHADVNAQTNGGVTPLHRAAMMGHRNIVQLLIKSNAKLDIQDDDGQTALHRSTSKGYVDISKDLIESLNDLKSIRDKKDRIPYDLIKNDNNLELKQLLMIVNF